MKHELYFVHWTKPTFLPTPSVLVSGRSSLMRIRWRMRILSMVNKFFLKKQFLPLWKTAVEFDLFVLQKLERRKTVCSTLSFKKSLDLYLALINIFVFRKTIFRGGQRSPNLFQRVKFNSPSCPPRKSDKRAY